MYFSLFRLKSNDILFISNIFDYHVEICLINNKINNFVVIRILASCRNRKNRKYKFWCFQYICLFKNYNKSIHYSIYEIHLLIER